MLSQEIPPISSAFQAVKSVAYREEEPSFVRVAAIHALGDFSWAFANQLISDQSLQDLLKQLASSADIQVADAALDIAQNLEWPEDHKPMMRSECVTAAGVTDIKWKRPKRPQPEHLREQAPNICDAHQQVIPEHLRVIATTYIGQNATLYRVLDLRDRREKCLKIANNNHPETQAAFATEINFLSDSNHPNILTLLEAYPALTLPAFVSPWLGNVTLLRYHQEQMRQGQSWQLNQFLEVMEQLCKATQYAHEKGWYHADLKPENIIWQSDGRVMICDWNSAKHKHTTHTSPSMIGGTPYYMAPEQLQINGQILDHRIDIYSIGIIAYELLSGFLPLGVAPPTLRDIRPELPIALDPILAKATALHANKRQSTAIALWYELTSASTTS
jgi:serine/threonine protein kinase